MMRKVSSHVWCDVHCTIHPAYVDYYQEGQEDCIPANWRALFVSPADIDEEF